MSVIWRKVWYDLWHNPLRTLLVVLSIAVGVFAVGATFGMVDQMLPAMDASHRASRPSHVTMTLLQPVDADTIRAIGDLPGVAEAEGYNVAQVRYKKSPDDEWHQGNILMRQDYAVQNYDVLLLKAGAWPEGRSLAIERMHAPFYQKDIGDTVILDVNGEEYSYTFTGKLRHPFVPPPTMYDLAWFFSGEEVMEQFGIPPGKFIQVKFQVEDYSSENARRIASQVKEWLSKQNVTVLATMYQDPEVHWGRFFVDGLSVVSEILAVLSLLLSVVLVMNTFTALITQQTNQIGILKAIGGTGFTVARVYLAGVLVIGLLSLAVALPLGSLAAYRITQWFLGLYNIDFETFSLSPRATWAMLLCALVFPLLAALAPVWSGARLTVRQAIASYGLGGDFGSTWLDRFVERIGRRFLKSYYAMALANIFRRKGRLALTQLVLVIAGVMFLMVMSLGSSISATTAAEFGRRTHDIVITFDDLQRIDRSTRIAQNVPGVEKAEMWLIAPATILHNGQKRLDAGLGSQLQGVPLEDPMYHPMIVAGRWLQAGDQRVVVMDKDTADDEGIRVGDSLTLDLGEWGQDEWQVVGLYQVFLAFGGSYQIDAIYAPRPAVFEATKKTGRAGTLLIRTTLHDPQSVTAVADRLGDVFENRNHIDIFQTETVPQLRQTTDTSFSYVVIMLLVLAVIIALVGGIGLMGALWIGVIERTKEIGILRAIGAVSSIITRMFVMEGVVQGLMSWLLAVPIALLVAPLLSNALGQAMFGSQMEYQFNYPAMFAWLGIILVISTLASLIPARAATKINVRQSISYE